MTPLLLLCALKTGPKFVVELPEAGPVVVVEALVPAPPDMGDREQAAWNVMADALYDGTAEFSRDRLREYASQAGVPLTIEAFPDFIKVQITEPKGGLKVASQILESLVLRASLTDEAIKESWTRLKSRRMGDWEQALLDFDLPYSQVTADNVRNVYDQAFRPDNIVFVFAGDLVAGEGQAQVDERFKGILAPTPRRIRFDRLPRTWVKHSGRVSTFEWRGRPLSVGKVDDLSTVLAVFALGVGKEGAMHRVLREKLGWTYRQEAVLWPSLKGWVPRLIFAKESTEADPELANQALEQLKSDVATWSDATLKRAKAMLKTSMTGDNPLCPFWTGLSGPFEPNLQDRASLAGINALCSGSPMDVADMVSRADAVTLAELKAAALKNLEESQASVIPGRVER